MGSVYSIFKHLFTSISYMPNNKRNFIINIIFYRIIRPLGNSGIVKTHSVNRIIILN